MPKHHKIERDYEDIESPETFTDETPVEAVVEDEVIVTTTEIDNTPPIVTATPVYRRLSLNNPPPEMAHLPRSQQKPLIAQANALQEQGVDVDEAIRQVLNLSS